MFGEVKNACYHPDGSLETLKMAVLLLFLKQMVQRTGPNSMKSDGFTMFHISDPKSCQEFQEMARAFADALDAPTSLAAHFS